MSLFNSVTLSVQNYTGAYVSGRYVETLDGAAFTVTGTWQPFRGDETQVGIEGRRTKSAYNLFTNSDLRIDKQDINGTSTLRSTISFGGDEYEIIDKQSWNNRLIPHFQYLCVREKERPAGTNG